tara:strand:- start:81 stop:464 length:384 start_codon:yes stop_codon:yes gene_type:complete
MKGNAAVLILDEQDRVLILKRTTKAWWMPGKWGLPGGRIDSGENSPGAVIRETKEETDLDIDISDLVCLKEFSNEVVDIYYCGHHSGTVRIGVEHDDFEWVTRDGIEDYQTTPNLIEAFDWILKNER